MVVKFQKTCLDTTSTAAATVKDAAASSSKELDGLKLSSTFFDKACEKLAKDLLGQKLVRVVDGTRLSGTIVETEAYLGSLDKAAHSYNGKRTEKTEAMFMPPGTAYVYNIYGMYCCLNISAQGDGAAVLLRALQPTENLETMSKLRTKAKDTSLMKKEGKDLCNGPSKLCQALCIKKETINKADLCSSADIWLESGDPVDPSSVVECKRINIDYAEDWVDKPLRYYVTGNTFVSVRNKQAEEELKKKP